MTRHKPIILILLIHFISVKVTGQENSSCNIITFNFTGNGTGFFETINPYKDCFKRVFDSLGILQLEQIIQKLSRKHPGFDPYVATLILNNNSSKIIWEFKAETTELPYHGTRIANTLFKYKLYRINAKTGKVLRTKRKRQPAIACIGDS